MASILYVATDEGVVTLKSADGHSWKQEHHGLKEWAVPEVAVAPGAPNKVYAGTRGDGVWLSEDFGATWKKPCYGKRGPGKVRCLSFDPHDANTIYAGTEPIDVFVSRDGARSWDRLDLEHSLGIDDHLSGGCGRTACPRHHHRSEGS